MRRKERKVEKKTGLLRFTNEEVAPQRERPSRSCTLSALHPKVTLLHPTKEFAANTMTGLSICGRASSIFRTPFASYICILET